MPSEIVEETKMIPKSATKKSTGRKNSEADKTGDHPPPKRALTAWTFFNSDKTK